MEVYDVLIHALQVAKTEAEASVVSRRLVRAEAGTA